MFLLKMTSVSFIVASWNEREYCAGLSWLANASHSRCAGLLQVIQLSPHSIKLILESSSRLRAATCARADCSAEQLLKVTFFAAAVPMSSSQSAERCVYSSQTCNSSVRSLSSHIFHSELWKSGVASQVGLAASALPGTRKFAGMKYDIRKPPKTSRRTKERVGHSWMSCDGERPPLQMYARIHFSGDLAHRSGGEHRVTLRFLPYKETIMLSAWNLSLTSLDDVMK